jgi:hypothetical protein
MQASARIASLIVVVAALVGLTSTDAMAYGLKCSGAYGFNNTSACVSVGTIAYTFDSGYFYNPTIINEQCSGTGTSCVTVEARSDSSFTNYHTFETPGVVVSFGHSYRARGSWNDASTGVRFTNAVSPALAQ